ncbi:uncharacterized protein LOC119668526 [Teleopsis dalmanni]|uniref:uncharacterized protein LOC119668526 n=1 Tax=Teleopsis dalmanni TaxID=139649 RepID=UPI0018CE38CC|nr:uncharacterized protein LOC119668526 [Teleopsis dalmanni]
MNEISFTLLVLILRNVAWINSCGHDFILNTNATNQDDELVLKSVSNKIFEIATKYASWVNLIYSSQDTNKLESFLFKKMIDLPVYSLTIDNFELEPNRNFTSINIFMMPESKINNTMFHKGNVDVVTIVHHRKIYTFEPYTEKGFQIKLIKNNKYFYDKLRNLHKLQLKISMFSDQVRAIPNKNFKINGFSAIDGMVAKTIINKLNATALYITPEDNESYGACRNGTFTGVIKDVTSGITQVAFNTRFVLNCMENHIEQLYPYHKRKLYLVVPAAKMAPQYLIFVNTFTNSVWRLLLTNYLFVCIFYIVLLKVTTRIINNYNVKKLKLLQILELFVKTQLGEPVEGFTKINSFRLFLISWILFSYVLTSIYFAKLESSFVQPTYESELDHLDDLYKLKVPIYAVNNLLDAVKDGLERKHWEQIKARSIELPLNFTYYSYTLPIVGKTKKNVAFILRKEIANDLLVNTFNFEEKRPSFHIVKQYLRSMQRTYVVSLGSPYYHKFQQLLDAFFEYGLLHHWLQRDTYHRQYSRNYYTDNRGFPFEFSSISDIDDDYIPAKVVLSLDILQGSFYLWSIGLLLSLIVFCVEYVIVYYKQIKRY